MGANNGSQRVRELRQEAIERYGRRLMTPEGVIRAALLEPYHEVCTPNCKHELCGHKEDREASRYWNYALINGVRVLCWLDPIENFL